MARRPKAVHDVSAIMSRNTGPNTKTNASEEENAKASSNFSTVRDDSAVVGVRYGSGTGLATNLDTREDDYRRGYEDKYKYECGS